MSDVQPFLFYGMLFTTGVKVWTVVPQFIVLLDLAKAFDCVAHEHLLVRSVVGPDRW